MKKTRKIIALAMSLMLVMSMGIFAFGASAENDYTIVSPYEDVIWSGDNAWGAYKGTVHSHTTYSDGGVDLATIVKEYYAQDYDFLANADHGITGVEWNKTPALQLLYAYQPLLGYKYANLTDSEFEQIQNGTYNGRGKGMTCVTGANELNNLSLTKNHVNGFFLPSNVGNGFGGVENEAGYDLALRFIEDNGGLSHINHPGDWLETNADPEAVNDRKNVEFFGNLLLKYDSCTGIEVLNEANGTTGYDRILWDNLLMYCLPYGKNVIGFSNTDAHSIHNIDSSFSVFMMEENTVENVKETMQNGALFAVTRVLRGNDFEIGPAEDFDVRNSGLDYPMFTSLVVDGHKITVTAKASQELQWIADGKVIYKGTIGTEPVTIDLDEIEGAADFTYVRAELKGEGGMCLSQALVIDDGSEALEFDESALRYDPTYIFSSGKIWAIISELIRAIKNAL